MEAGKSPYDLARSRAYIARAVQKLRKERRWTQTELSRRLELSQSRLSEIERGAGSFTAEQLLEILRLFNVAASDFAPPPADPASDLQNALARLGALQLHESHVLPSERLRGVNDVVREALVAGTPPRVMAALGPVLARNADRVNFKGLYLELAAVGLERRLEWLVESTLEALRGETPPAPPPWRRVYRRAQVVLESWLESLAPRHAAPAAPDVLDAEIRSKKTLDDVAARSSRVSRRWGIVTALQPEDFAAALRDARGAGR